MRGVLNEEARKVAQAFLGRDITIKELRLYPYLDYCLKNSFDWNPYKKMNSDELEILDKLQEEGFLNYSVEKIIVTRAFYDYIQNMLAITYVEEFLPFENEKN